MKTEIKTKIDWRIVLMAMACLTILECVALHYGINGKLFSLVVAIIAGLAGWTVPQLKLK